MRKNLSDVKRALGSRGKPALVLDFIFQDDKNTSMAKTGAKNLQNMKKIVLCVLSLVKESYKLSMKRIRYELSLDYKNGVERMLSMLDTESIKHALESRGKFTEK